MSLVPDCPNSQRLFGLHDHAQSDVMPTLVDSSEESTRLFHATGNLLFDLLFGKLS
jgi:hypothetical protein